VIDVKFLEHDSDGGILVHTLRVTKLEMLEPGVFIYRNKKTDRIVRLIVQLETDYEFKRNKDLIYLKIYETDTMYLVSTGTTIGKCKVSEYMNIYRGQLEPT
jgi:hypothetical protein